MDYEKKYKEAINQFKNFFTNNEDRILYKHDIERVFPELKESEDERIRKECISIIDAWDKSCRLQGDCCEVATKCIAWLEKQGKINFSWTEDDERYYNSALWHIKNYCGVESNIYNWLKRIKERIKGE